MATNSAEGGATPHLQVRKLGYALGAEIRGVDLRTPPTADTIAAIRNVWLEHQVVCLPDQDLGPEQLTAFTAAFGEVDDNQRNPYFRLPGHDEVIVVTNKPVDGSKWNGYRNGQDWHSDLSFTDHPATGTFLLCKTCPEVGGDTMFANLYMAYERLSPGMQQLIAPLGAIHDVGAAKGLEKRDPANAAAVTRMNPPIVHPLVRVHPETGRKALFVTERVRGFEGMTAEESRPLLDFLNQHAIRYEHLYRHRWKPNDLLMWDNRCLLHIALADFDLWNDRRYMIRASLLGPKAGRFYAAAAT